MNYQGPDAKIKVLGVSNGLFFTSLWVSINNLREENKILATETYEFDFWDTTELLPLFVSWNYQDCDGKTNMKDLSTETHFLSVNLSIKILMKEIKLVVTEKQQSDNRVEFVKITNYGVFGSSAFWREDFQN